jgi:hypothetical protein
VASRKGIEPLTPGLGSAIWRRRCGAEGFKRLRENPLEFTRRGQTQFVNGARSRVNGSAPACNLEAVTAV